MISFWIFSLSGHKAYKILVAQMEMEEDIYAYRAEEVFFDSVLFFEDFELNLVNLNSWFEIVRMNDPEADDHLLYASHLCNGRA
jgi:hypothetical protein